MIGSVRRRGREVTEAVSQIAANPDVRAVLVQRQRDWVAERGGGVVEGRDIGSVVFPDAKLKLFVTASPRVRAERRVGEMGGNVEDIEAAIIARDRKDSTRAHSPLTETDDAVVVDTTMKTKLDRIYAAGDVAQYPGKVKLIATGFGEAATAVNNIAVALNPAAHLFPGHSSNAG